MSDNSHLRYEPEERPPHALAAGMGAQIVVMILTGIMITPLVVSRTAGLDGPTTSWLVFGALIAAGLSTWLQVSRIGIIGSGYVMFVGSNAAFISVAVAAIQSGGPALLATLVAVSALATFLFTAKLPALRRILTPAVGGTVLMLMALSVAPIAWGMMKRVPAPFEGSVAVPMVVLATTVLIVAISLFATGALRLWAPLLGVLGGSAVAGATGMIDLAPIAAAPWVGLPSGSWPGMALDFAPEFWMLLPAFVLITLVGGIETYADSVSVQRTSRRQAQPIDFKGVQGAINADGLGSFIAGVLGTVPNTVYSSSVAVVELTGVASRRVGWWGGLFLILLAFCPKISAVVAAMPGPVAGAFIMMIIVLLFGHGIRLVNEDGLGFETGLAVCLGFWVGFGFQENALFNEMLPAWAKLFLSNSTTAGGLTAILLMSVLSLARRSRDKLTVPLEIGSIGQVRTLIQGFTSRLGWDNRAEDRLMLAAEEAMLFLLEAQVGEGRRARGNQLLVRLRRVGDDAELEYISAPAGSNAEAAMTSVAAVGEANPEVDLSLRLLRAMSKEVKHLQYHGIDYLLVRVDSTG
ncbi:NCS2 family nucleobase:cation symporter-2/xanthine permease XanP [Stella humosa]|uniref:NCS2 family nucleobase:cation symporter-2/xanthine permease XanP n=1 Tax=Stella humosa TaxID=94 RepID=A0A3N1KSM4_9PROT|nr:solute carrier family 23 protein [Stella humosa]ROP81390.1 NCS2 family nucleobase:cation symporter-2/xanthine permease XanP [Stella humosa]BBK32741.1 xanthine permease [Stella humosa]